MTDTSMESEPIPAPIPAPSFGRSMRSIAGYAILGAVMLVSPLFVFLPAALFHCGIRNGRRATLLVLLTAALAAAAISWPATHAAGATAADGHMSYAYLLALVLAIGVPSLLVQPMVERRESFGRVLLVALVISIAGLAATETIMRSAVAFSPYAEQVGAAKETAAKFVTAYEKASMPPDAVRFLKKWMNIGVYCLPAFLLIDVAVVFLFSLLMLGRLRAWRAYAQRQSTKLLSPYLFRNLSLPEWLLFAFVIGGLSPLATGMARHIAANVLAVVTFLYLLQGLAIFRSFVVAAGTGFIGAMFAYTILGVLTLTGIAPILLSITGLFDSFFDFRHFNRKDHSDESHSH